jgi:hypothetical protein
MAYTQSHLDALQEALASGTLTVTFEGRSMTYRSVQELQRAISVVQSSLNQQSGIFGSGGSVLFPGATVGGTPPFLPSSSGGGAGMGAAPAAGGIFRPPDLGEVKLIRV